MRLEPRNSKMPGQCSTSWAVTGQLVASCYVGRLEVKPVYSMMNTYTLLDGLAYNTRGYFASCVVFFRAPQGRGKMRAMSKMSASIIC